MMNKIYAFDFDGTLCTNKFPEIGKPIAKTIEMAKNAKKCGNYIILNTMREGEDIAKPVDRKKCPTCKYYNQNKKRCSLKMCKDQPSLFDYIGNRF